MNPQIFILAGKARHGKDTGALYIKEYYENKYKKVILTSFAKYIKMYATEISNWDGQEETKPRELLQKLGTEIIREKLNKEMLFVDRLKDDIDVYREFFDVVVIKDCRLPVEIEGIKEKFPKALAIHIKRINFETELKGKELIHRTEVALDEYKGFDYEVINDTLDIFKENIFNMLKEVEKSE